MGASKCSSICGRFRKPINTADGTFRMSYDRIARKLAKGDIIILDGGTGTDIQSRGVPMAGETWCAEANLTHPAVVRCVHEDYIAAGAEIITANTYPTSPLLFNALGRDDDMIRIDKEAVRIAREASRGPRGGRRLVLRHAADGAGRRPGEEIPRMERERTRAP